MINKKAAIKATWGALTVMAGLILFCCFMLIFMFALKMFGIGIVGTVSGIGILGLVWVRMYNEYKYDGDKDEDNKETKN